MKKMKVRAPREYQHPLVIRLTHWINAVALVIMVTSGYRIYNASPLWDFEIPALITLGGWLAGARMWHFFGMWLFAVNGIVWGSYNLLSRHGRRTTLFGRADLNGLLPMILYYLRIRREHPASGKYNPLQKLAYSTIPLAALGSLLSGIALFWPVQFSGIASLFGGYDWARGWHFVFSSMLVLFTFGHLVMVVLAGWSNFLSIITGYKSDAREGPQASGRP